MSFPPFAATALSSIVNNVGAIIAANICRGLLSSRRARESGATVPARFTHPVQTLVCTRAEHHALPRAGRENTQPASTSCGMYTRMQQRRQSVVVQMLRRYLLGKIFGGQLSC